MLQKIQSILLKSSFRQVGLYTVTGALSKVISFAALPFFVNTLTEGDIGILNIFNSSIVFLTPVISMGVLYTISVDYFKLSKPDYAAVFSTSLIIPAFFSFLLIPVFYIFWQPLDRAFSFQYEFIWLIPLSLFCNFCFEAFIILLRMQNNLKLFATISLLKMLVEIVLSVLLLIYIFPNWYSRAMGYFLSAGLIAVLFFFHIKNKGFLIKKIDYKVLKGELLFGLSGLLLQTAVFFIGTSDKFFVMSFFGKEQAGFYAVAATFATIQYIVSSSLMQYLQPVLYTNFSGNKPWAAIKGLYVKYSLAMFGTMLALLLFAFIVYKYLLKGSYQENIHYFYLLSISSFIWSVTNIFLQYIIFNKHKKIITQLSVMSIVFSLAINFTASVYFNINWLCAAQIITNVFVLVVTLHFNHKLNRFS